MWKCWSSQYHQNAYDCISVNDFASVKSSHVKWSHLNESDRTVKLLGIFNTHTKLLFWKALLQILVIWDGSWNVRVQVNHLLLNALLIISVTSLSPILFGITRFVLHLSSLNNHTILRLFVHAIVSYFKHQIHSAYSVIFSATFHTQENHSSKLCPFPSDCVFHQESVYHSLINGLFITV